MNKEPVLAGENQGMTASEAVAKFRSRLMESQQRFSNRFNLSIRAIANYEAGRQPTRRVLTLLRAEAVRFQYADLAEALAPPPQPPCPNCRPSDEFAQFVLEKYGRRCGEHEPECILCRAWEIADEFREWDRRR